MRTAGDLARPGLDHLVLLHGFTQTAASWGPVVDALQEPFSVFLPDAPGHGGSGAVRADLWATADLLAEVVPVTATWVGYSMGGRTALHFALAHPGRVQRLVLISTSAGFEDPGQRAARRAADEALAHRVEQEGTERFLEWWLAQPLFASLSPQGAGLEDRLDQYPRRARFQLAIGRRRRPGAVMAPARGARPTRAAGAPAGGRTGP